MAARALLLMMACVATGCVDRYLRLDTTPPGALVYYNGQEVGETPVEIPFVHYGTVRVDLYRDGHRPQTRWLELKRPWYQWIPLDFFAELLDPRTHVDRHDFHFPLEPQDRPPLGEGPENVGGPPGNLLERADELRRRVW